MAGMVRNWGRGAGAVMVALMSLLAHAQGLESFEASARAAGVAGAFTAQVDDPSAIFYNPGALGLLKKKKGASVGVTASQPSEELYQGLAPGIGAGTAAERETERAIVPHVFATLPLGGRLTAGIGYYTPLRMESTWGDPGQYAGRHLATASRIESSDLAATAGVALAPWLGIGGGAVYRTSQIEASRHLAAQFAGTPRDVATLQMETDSVRALGWTAGLLIRPSPRFSLGARYRSAIETEYEGAGNLTQIATGDPQFDALIAASFPFGQDVALQSRLEFPAEASVGVAVGLGAPLLLEVGATRTEWSDVDAIGFAFPNNASLNTTYPLALESATTYRAGLRFQFPTGPQLRVGYAMTRSAQPDETVGAFLTDADRSTITAGFGLDWLDIAAGYTTFETREIVTNVEGLNGIYRAGAWSVTLSVTK